MKIIDLYIKIANGEEVPHFIIDDIEYHLDADGSIIDCDGYAVEWSIYKEWLNKEVEIIEEEKGIAPLDKKRALIGGGTNETMLFLYCTDLETKLNETIEALNEIIKEK